MTGAEKPAPGGTPLFIFSFRGGWEGAEEIFPCGITTWNYNIALLIIRGRWRDSIDRFSTGLLQKATGYYQLVFFYYRFLLLLLLSAAMSRKSFLIFSQNKVKELQRESGLAGRKPRPLWLCTPLYISPRAPFISKKEIYKHEYQYEY